jgi:hypothetical protein
MYNCISHTYVNACVLRQSARRYFFSGAASGSSQLKAAVASKDEAATAVRGHRSAEYLRVTSQE